MPLKVIELNDSCLRAGDENGIIFESPGFALVTSDQIEVGDCAEEQARLQPTNIFNKYWHELSLEPVPHNRQIRHHADLAYMQLKNIAEVGNIDGEVIFAVPSNFTREQLGILLGLCQKSPFKVVGLVDSALLAASTAAQAEHIVYADIQLHQVVLTKLAVTDNYLAVQGVTQIPGVGIQNFKTLMMQIATDLFIHQCRFNPQHNAYSEQQLYNELNSWLLQVSKEQTLLLELKSGDAAHTAKLPRESLVAALNGQYKKINTQIKAMLTGSKSQVLLSERLAGLPDYISTLSPLYDLVVLDHNRAIKACHDYEALITDDKEEIHLVTKFLAEKLGIKQSVNKPMKHQLEIATHILYDNRAIEIDNIEIKNSISDQCNIASTKVIYINLGKSVERFGSIKKRGDGIYFKCSGGEVFLNGDLITGEHALKLGDRIQFSKHGKAINLIKVDNG